MDSALAARSTVCSFQVDRPPGRSVATCHPAFSVNDGTGDRTTLMSPVQREHRCGSARCCHRKSARRRGRLALSPGAASRSRSRGSNHGGKPNRTTAYAHSPSVQEIKLGEPNACSLGQDWPPGTAGRPRGVRKGAVDPFLPFRESRRTPKGMGSSPLGFAKDAQRRADKLGRHARCALFRQ